MSFMTRPTPLRAVLAATLALMLALATAVCAETFKKRYSSGNWTLYSASVFEMDFLGKALKLRNACIAETGSSVAKLRIIVLPGDYSIVQVTSSSWSFRSHKGDVTLFFDESSLKLLDADYRGNAIQHITDPKDGGTSGIQFMAFLGKKTISLADERGRLRAKFPYRGFDKIYKRTLTCAGLTPTF